MKQKVDQENNKENPDQTQPHTDKQNSPNKQKKEKPLGELVTIKLRNGDKKSYRKRIKNLTWKIEQEDLLQNGESPTKKSPQKYKNTENSYSASPTKYSSMSPKKHGKEARESLLNSVMNCIRKLNVVRYQSPK